MSLLFDLTRTLVLLSIFFQNSSAQCMDEVGVATSFPIEGVCYWIYPPESFTTWKSAVKLCQKHGTIAYINSTVANNQLAATLTRPAYIGYAKNLEGIWSWVDSSSTFFETFTDNQGVHMSIIDGSGRWEPTNVDATGHKYDLLCSIDMVPYLMCPVHVVANSLASVAQPVFSGSSITFTCFSGFHISVGKQVQTIECVPGNRWNAFTRDCTPITCDSVNPPAYTERDSDAVNVGAEVLYTCTDPDTWFGHGQTTMNTRCQPDGTWDPPVRSCEFIRCDPPPIVEMAIFNSSSTLYGVTIEYECINGWIFSDGNRTKSINCEGNPPIWTDQVTLTSLICDPIYCANEKPSIAPSQVDGLIYSHSHLPYLDQVGVHQMWYCIPGFTHLRGQTGTASRCYESADPNQPNDWSPPIPSCEQIACPGLEIQNTTANALVDYYHIGFPLILTCPSDEWVFPGGSSEITITCNYTGFWDFEPPLSGCDRAECETGWVEWKGSCYYFSNGNSLGLRYESAEAYCNLKYSNLAVITSETEALWVGKHTYDVYGRDFWIGLHANDTNNWVWKGGLETDYSKWVPGYPERFDCVRSSVDGYWKDRDCDELLPYICKKSSICGSAPVIANGFASVLPKFPVQVGTTMQFECNWGYRFLEGSITKTIQCEAGGYWSEISNCVFDTCDMLNEHHMEAHGTYVDKTDNYIGSIVTFTCLIGKLFPSRSQTHVIECLRGGQWNDTVPECEDLDCPIPAVYATTPTYSHNTWGSMDYYQCENGYSFQDHEVSKLFRCVENGTWVPNDQYCIPRSCGKFSHFFANATPDEGSYKDEITVICREGYEFDGLGGLVTQTIKCSIVGTWEPLLPPCIPTACPGPTPPNVTNAIRSTDEITTNTVVNYTCLYGYVYINGDQWRIAECDKETKQWVNVPPGCVDNEVIIETEFSHPPVESPQGVTIFSFGACLFGVLVTAVIVLDMITLPRQIRFCKYNLNLVKTVKTPTAIKKPKTKPMTQIAIHQSAATLTNISFKSPADMKSLGLQVEEIEERKEKRNDLSDDESEQGSVYGYDDV